LKLLKTIGIAMLVLSAMTFFWLVHRGSDSPILFLAAAIMYASAGITLFAIVIRWSDD
jgi:hypothetical protein